MISYRVEKISGLDLVFGFKDARLVFVDVLENMDFIYKKFGKEKLSEGPGSEEALGQFKEYFKGERKVFTLDFDLVGTDFQRSVWDQAMKIPYGTRSSYRDLAMEIARPGASRAVGAALGQNPIFIMVPCHRVLRADGSLGGYRGGLDLKARLLDLEKNNAIL